MRIVSEIGLRSIRLSSLEFKRSELALSVGETTTPERIEQIRRERAEHLLAAGVIIRGAGPEGHSASEFAGSHLGTLLRQNDLLTGVDSGTLPTLAIWVEAERYPLGYITPDLERYVAMQELGLRDGLLPLLTGDDEARRRV